MSNQIIDAIYDHLTKKFDQLNNGLTLEQQTELDSVLWDLSKVLACGDSFRIEIDPKGNVKIMDYTED